MSAPTVGPVFDSLPIGERTITNLVMRAARSWPSATLAEMAAGDVRFGDLPESAGRFSAGLAARGLGVGDVVGSILPNRPEFIVTFCGAAWAGTPLVSLGVELSSRFIASRLGHSGCSLVVVDADVLDDVRAAVSTGLPDLRTIVVVGGDAGASVDGVDVIEWDDFLDRRPRVAVERAYDDVLMINYTSGTTGPSKGVVITHHHAYCGSVPVADGFGWTPEDVLWTSLPLNHAAAMNHVLLPALAVGARAIIRSRFSLSAFWDDVAGVGATYVQLIATMANLLLAEPEHPLERSHSLRAMSCFPVPHDPDAFEDRFGVRLNYQAWGMTEVYPNQPDLAQPKLGKTCVGKPSSLFELKLVDDREMDVAADGTSVGEIVVRPRLASSMIREYFRDPDATLAAMRNMWFHTGDLGTVDGDGFVYFAGRKKDMIRRRGENISAGELEAEVMAFPGVTQAAAYGVPSELGEEDVKVDVTVRPGTEADGPDIARFLADRVPRFMVPRYVEIRDAFPTTPSGKVEKYKLREEGVGPSAVDVDGDRADST